MDENRCEMAEHREPTAPSMARLNEWLKNEIKCVGAQSGSVLHATLAILQQHGRMMDALREPDHKLVEAVTVAIAEERAKSVGHHAAFTSFDVGRAAVAAIAKALT